MGCHFHLDHKTLDIRYWAWYLLRTFDMRNVCDAHLNWQKTMTKFVDDSATTCIACKLFLTTNIFAFIRRLTRLASNCLEKTLSMLRSFHFISIGIDRVFLHKQFVVAFFCRKFQTNTPFLAIRKHHFPCMHSIFTAHMYLCYRQINHVIVNTLILSKYCFELMKTYYKFAFKLSTTFYKNNAILFMTSEK